MLGPPRCVVCGARIDWLCGTCARDAAPPRASVAIPGIARTVSPWAYEGGPRSLILALKLRHMRSAAAPLAQGIARSCRSARVGAEVVTWVPARRRDRARRGFDHAEVLARGVAGHLGLPVVGAIARRGSQRDQAGLDRVQRLSNLSGAFTATRSLDARVLLIDDLVTTGATATECASSLASAGAARVELATACIA